MTHSRREQLARLKHELTILDERLRRLDLEAESRRQSLTVEFGSAVKVARDAVEMDNGKFVGRYAAAISKAGRGFKDDVSR